MNEPGWIVLLPPLLAIILAIWTRQVYVSLFAGIALGWVILSGWNPLIGIARTLEGIVNVFSDSGDTKVVLFMLLVGALIMLMQRSGGVTGFVEAMSKQKWAGGRRGSQIVAAIMGCAVFIETSISALIVGSVSRPLFDQNKVSREKLAYICDSTSAPVNVLVPFNAWGAFILGLLAQSGVEKPIGTLLTAIPLNFYPLLTVALVFFFVLSGKDFGPMKTAEVRVREKGKLFSPDAKPVVAEEVTMIRERPEVTPRAWNFALPVLTMVICVPLFMVITGDGDITRGSGSTSVFWAVFTALSVATVAYALQGIMDIDELTNIFLKGMGGLVPLALLMVLAFAIGDVTQELGTGEYVAHLATLFLHPVVIPVILFISSGLISFSTGTSWGTFAIMIPIAVPIAVSSGISLPLVVAAVLGGGIFGDHSSPISDTTMVSSMAAATDHIDHVRTQLPYALLAGGASVLLYLIAAMI